MSYQPPLTNGLPPSAMPQSQSFSKYMPPGHQSMGSIPQQYQPPPQTNYVPSSAMAGTKFPLQSVAGPPIPQLQQRQQQQQQPQNLLVNGGSNHSSRTASPALNQTLNTAHLPPASNLYGSGGGGGGDMAQKLKSSQNQSNLMTSGTMTGSMTDVTSQQNQQNMSKLAASMQNVSLANGPVSSAQPPPPPPVTTTTTTQQHFPNQFGSGVGQTRPPAINGMQTNSAPMRQTIPSNQINGPTNQPRPTLGPFDVQQNVNQFKMPPPAGHSQMPPPAGHNQMPLLAGQNQMPLPSGQSQMMPPPPMQNQMPPSAMQNQMPPLSTSQPLPNQFQLPPSSQPQYSAGQQFSAPSMSANSTTLNKRPMYPPTSTQQQQLTIQQQHQQMPPPQNQQQSPQYGNANYQPNQMYNGQSGAEPNQMNYPGTGQTGGKMNVVQQGFNKFWGQDTIDLMQQRHVLPATRVKPPTIHLGHEFYDSVNCSPDIIRCTLTKIPESNSLLQKSRLPFGILIHPFRDLNNLPVIQCSQIVRCRSCRTYINPFVTFVDSKKWRCNLCYRVSELPDEFQYDPVSKTYGDVTRRPEVKSSTIEFIAPSEYMLRPPQPAIYVFLLDVSLIAQQTGYLDTACTTILEHLDNLPGDARTRVGFLAYNSAVHFYSIADGFNQPHEITVVDIDDAFLPFPDNLLINLKECKDLIKDLLTQLPTRFANTYDSNSALGAALQISYKLLHQYGGRVTVFQCCLPNVGPGALQARENPNDRSSKNVQHLGPATDFYKRLALECSTQQIAVDLFLLNSQYSDLATLSGISRFSGGCIYHYPLFAKTKHQHVDLFRRGLERYLQRKIGFESVMRVRCTRGLAIHTFHGNFFVRSTDLLSLPNINPDAGFGMQISYEESLTDTKTVCFQAALLYTSSRGERRIRVHTICLPVVSSLLEVMNAADQQAIIGLISKMAVDRSLQSSISDARDAFINASVDVFSAFRLAQNLPQGGQGQMVAPINLCLLPIYMMALLKHVAFRTGTSTRLDDRIFAMCQLKSLPLDQLIRYIYPDFYRLDELFYSANADNEEEKRDPPLLQLSAEKLDSRSVFMMDSGPITLILVGSNVPVHILQNVFDVSTINEIPDLCYDLPNTGKPESDALHNFIDSISVDKPFTAVIQIIRDTSPLRSMFVENLVEDKSENTLSYYEFLQHLRSLIK